MRTLFHSLLWALSFIRCHCHGWNVWCSFQAHHNLKSHCLRPFNLSFFRRTSVCQIKYLGFERHQENKCMLNRSIIKAKLPSPPQSSSSNNNNNNNNIQNSKNNTSKNNKKEQWVNNEIQSRPKALHRDRHVPPSLPLAVPLAMPSLSPLLVGVEVVLLANLVVVEVVILVLMLNLVWTWCLGVGSWPWVVLLVLLLLHPVLLPNPLPHPEHSSNGNGPNNHCLEEKPRWN